MIILSLGSNLNSDFGNRYENINFAIDYLSFEKYIIVKKSSFYETPSYPDSNNPKFINIALVIKPIKSSSLEDLVDIIFSVEKKIGRTRNKKNDPRTIDIDIIDYNNKVLEFQTSTKELIKVPHGKMALRNFVLFPLREICPHWKHPETGIHVDKLIDKLPDVDKKSILKVKYN
tara:strand:- start:6987 stop:7508 length:522 start_codon:yes stop_codon:yes gene_type:complete